MAGYANSRPRVALLVMLILGALFVMAGPSWADTTADQTAAVGQAGSIFSLILTQKDPVFYTHFVGLVHLGIDADYSGVSGESAVGDHAAADD